MLLGTQNWEKSFSRYLVIVERVDEWMNNVNTMEGMLHTYKEKVIRATNSPTWRAKCSRCTCYFHMWKISLFRAKDFLVFYWSLYNKPIYLTGKRWNTCNAYLRPALDRTNLKTETRAMITRVLFEGNRAVGVEYEVDNQVGYVCLSENRVAPLFD